MTGLNGGSSWPSSNESLSTGAMSNPQFAIRRDIERPQTATESSMEAGVRIIELSQSFIPCLLSNLRTKAVPTGFRSVELLMERWANHSGVPATL
jgi:hypothetical protein